MKKDNSIYLEHILICIEKINKYTKGIEYTDFLKNEMMQDALIRLIGIIGEASTKISSDIKNKYTQIQWADIKGMRNRIIHDYFDVRLDVIWDTVIKELPFLKQQIIEIIPEVKKQTTLDFDDRSSQ